MTQRRGKTPWTDKNKEVRGGASVKSPKQEEHPFHFKGSPYWRKQKVYFNEFDLSTHWKKMFFILPWSNSHYPPPPGILLLSLPKKHPLKVITSISALSRAATTALCSTIHRQSHPSLPSLRLTHAAVKCREYTQVKRLLKKRKKKKTKIHTAKCWITAVNQRGQDDKQIMQQY